MRYGSRRAASRWFARRTIPLRLTRPIISFTFDDFPQNALTEGGAILREHGFRGTYYAAFGLMGSNGPTGPIFHAADIEVLLAEGHELGCHTFAHCHAWETAPHIFEQSVIANRDALQVAAPGTKFQTLAYPKFSPRPAIKKRAGRHFGCCRGGGQRCNSGNVDLNLVSAFFIEKSGNDRSAIEDIIKETCDDCGWLVFATHDIDTHPTRFGCTPSYFEMVVQLAALSGALVLPVAEVLNLILNPGPRRLALKDGKERNCGTLLRGSAEKTGRL